MWLVAGLLMVGLVFKHAFDYRVIFDVVVAWLILWLYIFTEDIHYRTKELEPKVESVYAVILRWLRRERIRNE